MSFQGSTEWMQGWRSSVCWRRTVPRPGGSDKKRSVTQCLLAKFVFTDIRQINTEHTDNNGSCSNEHDSLACSVYAIWSCVELRDSAWLEWRSRSLDNGTSINSTNQSSAYSKQKDATYLIVFIHQRLADSYSINRQRKTRCHGAIAQYKVK